MTLFFLFLPLRTNMATPVPVLRLPKGPEPNSRGFDPKSARYMALCHTSIPASSTSDEEQLRNEQHARSVLREKFLRCLLCVTNKKVQFHMHEQVKVEATFGASDIDVLNFQVSDLHTPIGVQKEALIRAQDVISFSFDVWACGGKRHFGLVSVIFTSELIFHMLWGVLVTVVAHHCGDTSVCVTNLHQDHQISRIRWHCSDVRRIFTTVQSL